MNLALAGFLVAGAVGWWLWPQAVGRALKLAPDALVYGALGVMALGSVLAGRGFTLWYARATTPKEFWDTPEFRTINLHMSLGWCALFWVSAALASAPALWGIKGGWALAARLAPLGLLLIVGKRLLGRYPQWYISRRRKAMNRYEEQQVQGDKQKQAESPGVADVVAINGSPHGAAGNTGIMLGMLGEALAEHGLSMEVITLADKKINYCVGCALCLDKGACWQRDEHAGIVRRLLKAKAVVLGSPVYVLHVTAQMKTFLDRCLGLGHRPQPHWRPGAVVSVSAGCGETQVADYLEGILRIFGAWGVGRLTAVAPVPGQLLGKEAVEHAARRLGRDLASAVKEGWRAPATDRDLAYHSFMSRLISSNKELMRADYAHWQKLGILEDVEAYVGQRFSPPAYDEPTRRAWLKQLMGASSKTESPSASPQSPTPSAQSCKELIRSMAQAYAPPTGEQLNATIQFVISGQESFRAWLELSPAGCRFAEGTAPTPTLTIHAPADVWKAIATGQMDGASAFMSGKFRAEGDMGLLMRLNELFPRR